MSTLKKRLGEKIDAHRPRTVKLLKEFGDVKVGEINIAQTMNGMRGVKSLTTDISYLDPVEGIRFRGKTIPEVMEEMPKPDGKDYPYVEGFWFFLLTGDVPTKEEAEEIVEEFKKRRELPSYVLEVLKSLPEKTHPMAMFSAAILSMQGESEFNKYYSSGNFNKMDAWEYMYEDATNIIARIPSVAAYIYRLRFKDGDIIEPDFSMDMGGNFAHQMGIPNPYDDVARMYFIIHSDHESGNASAHTTHLVGSTLSDAYYSLSGGLNALAGPLHGLANQEVLAWVQEVREQMNGKLPSEEEMKKFVWDTLNSGNVIPGYGHAVLRKTDPRYQSQREFCLKHLPDDEIFAFVDILYKVVPEILKEHGKAKNPWPNVDAQSGVIQWFYGLKEFDFYTVLFGVGRAIGVLANLTWDRALGYAIERPKSLTTDMLEKIAGIK